jgi:TolB-like protein
MRGFIEELRHRNVIRVGVAYVIAGWLLAQVADLAADAFNAPDWVMQMLIVVLLVGLPVALFLAWAYELTPDGVIKAKDVPVDMPKDPRSGRMLNRIIIATLVLAIAGLVWDRVTLDVSAPAPASSDKSIAVLPFADFSPGGDQTWFADGLTDEILNALARTRDLRVASRTSSFAYRGSDLDIPTIASELNVAHVLEGSVRRAGDRIRVTAQLIRASDDAHLWSQTFDANSDDSIEIQEDIAFEIASLLDTAMDPEELREMVAAGTDSIAAWEDYLQMRALSIQSTDEFDSASYNYRILSLYNEIITIDPEFADAHLLMAETTFSWMDPNDIGTAPEGYSHEQALQLFLTASAAATEFAQTEETRLRAGVLRARMRVRLDDVVNLTRALVELRPTDLVTWGDHLDALIVASRFDEAREFSRRMYEQDWSHEGSLYLMYYRIARVDPPLALRSAREALARPSPKIADYYQSHRVFLMNGEVGEAAVMARRFLEMSDDASLGLLIRIRQACAEGRVDDANALFADFGFGNPGVGRNNIEWLALKTLGRDAEAEAVLRPLDQPAMLYALAQTLTYPHFDPRPFPNLSAVLQEQGMLRENPQALVFACPHED